MSSEPSQTGDGATAPQALLTRPVNDPMQPLVGFDEVYWCTECNDYFVLAWQPVAEPLPSRCQRVAPPKRDPGSVFCPGCSEAFADYGPILPYVRAPA
jgi:hypothetical protein